MATDLDRLVDTQIADLEAKAEWLAEFNQTSVAISNALLERAYNQVREENRRVVTELRKVPLPQPQSTLKEILIGIGAGFLALGILTAYATAKPAPSCPPMVNKGTLTNPLNDTNWKVISCPDSRDSLSKLVRPILGIYR